MSNINYFYKIVSNVMLEIANNFPAYTSLSIDNLLPLEYCEDRDFADMLCFNTIE